MSVSNKKIVNCTICLEDIEDNIEFLPCIHGFHYNCIKKWINQKPECPICKISIYITTSDQLENYNEYKRHIDLADQEEAKVFHQISANNTTANAISILNSIRSNNMQQHIMPISNTGQLRDITLILQLFDALINRSITNELPVNALTNSELSDHDQIDINENINEDQQD